MIAWDHVARERGEPAAAIGQLPAFAAVACGLGVEDEFLNDIVLVALEDGVGGRVGEGHEDFAVDGELGVLGPLVGAGTFLRCGRGRMGRGFENAGPERGPWLEPLEEGDLVLKLGDAFVLLVDDVE